MKTVPGAANQRFEGLSGATATAGRTARDPPPTADQFLRPGRDIRQREGSPNHPGGALCQGEALNQPEMRALPPLLLKGVQSLPPRGEAVMAGLQTGKMESLLLVSDLTQVRRLSREVTSLHQFPPPFKKGHLVFEAKSQQSESSHQ